MTMNSTMRKIVGALALLALTATVAYASGGGEGHHADSGALLKDFLYRCFNFAVTFGILAYFVTKPIRNGLAGRREGVAKALEAAQKAKDEAEAKFAEYDRKLADAAKEIEEVYAEIRREGELEKERILANARDMAEKVRREAESSAEQEIARARVELRREASKMAIVIAEGLLKENTTADDHARLVGEYMNKVGELH
ncbi:MAG: ATPase [Desulfuromonas sp.]|nr:MAG: ATPase [Desulfuromonas sp.]